MFRRRAVKSVLVLLFCLLPACTMTVGAVNPTPNVAITGNGTYSIDVSKVPDTIEPMPGATVTQLRQSLTYGFRNAMGDAFARGDRGDVRLVIDSFNMTVDEGQIGVLRITYRARWQSNDGEVITRFAGTALPKNPIQTGEGHVRDVIEVMYEQMVDAFDKAQEKYEQKREKADQSS